MDLRNIKPAQVISERRIGDDPSTGSSGSSGSGVSTTNNPPPSNQSKTIVFTRDTVFGLPRFPAGLIVGAFIGGLFVWGYIKYRQNNRFNNRRIRFFN